MAQDEIHVNDIGTVFEITVQEDGVAVDISGATVKNIIFEKPTKVKVTQTGVFSTDGTDGKIRYTSVSGDIDIAKYWKIQALITIPSGTFYTDISEFQVYANI